MKRGVLWAAFAGFIAAAGGAEAATVADLSTTLVAGGRTAAGVPMVVEMFTSKYCPNCPAAEHKMLQVAPEHPELLIVFEHVDYWDQPAAADPYGLADVTQRQYDYSNTLLRRAGEVFTPMPLLNGRVVVKPPLMFNWDDGLKAGQAAPQPVALMAAKTSDGGLVVDIPAALAKHKELYVLGLEPVDGGPVMRLRGIVQADAKAGSVRVAPALLPKFEKLLVLLQEEGPGAVVGVGKVGF